MLSAVVQRSFYFHSFPDHHKKDSAQTKKLQINYKNSFIYFFISIIIFVVIYSFLIIFVVIYSFLITDWFLIYHYVPVQK